MKINRLFIKLFVNLVLLSATIFANTNMSGLLKSGHEIILKPHNGHALTITRTPGKYISNSSYDFIMLNGRDIIYEDRDQVDDVYLIFHDDVQEGDKIKIHVNRGYFDYEIKPLQALPTIVKEVIEPEVLQKAQQTLKREAKAKKERQKREAKRLKKEQAKRVAKSHKEEIAIPVTKSKIATREAQPKVEKVTSTTTPSPVSESFFAKFTQIFKDLVKNFSLAPVVTPKVNTPLAEAKPNVEKVAKKEIKKRPQVRGIGESFDDSALQQAAAKKELLKMSGASQGVRLESGEDLLKEHASLEQSTFAKPQRGIGENFDDRALQVRAAVEEKSFSQAKAPVITSSLTAKIEEKFQGLQQQAPQFKETKLSQSVEPIPHFKAGPTTPDVALATPAESFKKEGVPTFTNPLPAKKIEVVEKPHEVVLKKESEVLVANPTPKMVAPQTAAPRYTEREPTYPDTGYKEGYESLNQQPKPLREVEKPKPLPPVVIDKILPQKAVAPKEGGEKRLVITKMIDKKEPKVDPFAGRVLGRMDDRVLGTGYNGASSSAKLGMRVTKNRKPVSAWIEVFKNGTKQRVKTFYTSKTRKAKSVKLPAGTYMVRATYRTRGSKQQKTVKNIHLQEGDSVTKNIAFYDGTLRVIARRGGDPLYVKVIAYKSGTHQRVSYDFSSRTSGIAKLTLSSGRYDIEVLEHDKSRFFENVRIRGGKTKTINADF